MSTLYKVAKNLDVVPRFYLLCFAFMIAMEGYYDELSRLECSAGIFAGCVCITYVSPTPETRSNSKP